MATHIPRRNVPRHTAGDAVLIIGAGLAGLYAALKLAPRRALVIAPRGPTQAAASAWAQGGIAAALGPDDTPDQHAADTIAAGDGLSDPVIAHLLAEEGPGTVRALAELGVPFDRTSDGDFVLSREAAHGRARVARVGGDTAGREIMKVLGRAALAADHIEVRSGLTAIDLLRDDAGRVAGVLAIDTGGNLLEIQARDTVLATGGVGGLFAVTTNPPTARGDALAMAARAGAVIADPEFVQFHPTAIDIGRDPAPLATEALRGAGARLVDDRGRDLCDPLAPRDHVARVVHRARRSGQSPLLDARSAIGARFPDDFPTVFESCMSANIDPRTDLIPIAPAAHYHMGGAATDDRGRTTVPGLWALGEAASTGAHGANRLASNSLLEAAVFANRAAQALRQSPGEMSAGAHSATPPETLSSEGLAQLRTRMSQSVGVERDGDGLGRTHDWLETLSETTASQPNPVLAARLIVAGALARSESRGAHARTDFPDTAPHPQRTRLVLAGGQVRQVETAPV